MYSDAEKAKMRQRINGINSTINSLEYQKSDYYNLRNKIVAAVNDLKVAKNNISDAKFYLKQNYSSDSNTILSQNLSSLGMKYDEVASYISKLNGTILSEIDSEISSLNSRISSLESQRASIRMLLNS